jgi:large subunit ribosomal protein L32
MAVPKHRTTKSRQLKRRQHIFLEKPNLVKCSNCGHFTLPHTVCPYCGYYRKMKVLDVLKKLEKKERKKREKEFKEKEEKEKKIQKRPLDWRELSKK